MSIEVNGSVDSIKITGNAILEDSKSLSTSCQELTNVSMDLNKKLNSFTL